MQTDTRQTDSGLDFGRLRPMVEDDLAVVLAWRNHPSIRSKMYSQHEITKAEHQAWWDRVQLSDKTRVFIFERRCLPLAYVAFSDVARGANTATWGFYTAPGSPAGTGSLMALAAMDMAFAPAKGEGADPLGLRKLNSEAIGSNTASIALHESFGFQREGVFHAHVLIGNVLEDVVRFALFADNWRAWRPAKVETLTERLSR